MVKELRVWVILSLGAALMFSLKLAMVAMPNVEPVTLLTVLFARKYGIRAMAMAFCYVMLEGFFFGFGLWFWSYLYIWPILVLLVVLFRKQGSPFFWAPITGAYGLCFGALMSLPYLLIGGPVAALSYWIAGLWFDVVHAASNFMLTLLLFKPLNTAMDSVR